RAGPRPPVENLTGGLADDPRRLPLAPRGRRPAGPDQPGRRHLRQRGAARGLRRAPPRRLAARRWLRVESPHPVAFRNATDALHEGGRPEVRAFLGTERPDAVEGARRSEEHTSELQSRFDLV